MSLRRFGAFVLLVAGAAVILTAGPEHGINGVTILGVLLALAGIVLAD